MSLRYTLRHLKGVDINLDNIKDWELACSEDTLKIYWRHGDVIEDVTKGAADYATEQAKTLTALINSFNADLAVELAKAEASATAAASSASSANDILLQNQSIKTAISTIENEINTLCSDTKKAASQVATDKTDIEAIQTDINTTKTAIDTKATEVATNATNAKTSETNAANSATEAKNIADAMPKLVSLTQAEYDALATKDGNTWYFISA